MIEAPVDLAPPPGVVAFEGRTIDLRAHLEGYPYVPALVVPDAGTLFYDRVGDTQKLLAAPLAPSPDLAIGASVSAIDWSTRTREDLRWHAPSKTLLYLGDEKNDEKVNLWRLDPATGALSALTDEPYLYGYGVSDDGGAIAVLPRRPRDGSATAFRSCLDVMGADGTARREVLCDTPAAQLTWAEPAWSPDGRGVLVAVDVDGRRDRSNLAWVSVAPGVKPELRIVTDPLLARSDASAVRPWLDDHTFVYVSDEGGFTQLYTYDLDKAASRRLTSFDRDIVEARLVRAPGGPARVIVVLYRPDGDAIVVVDPADGRELSRIAVGGSATLLGDDGVSKVWVSMSSGSTPLAVLAGSIDAAGSLSLAPLASVPVDVAARVVRCDQRAVTYPTWDLDPATHAPRLLHAFLYVPKDPPKDDRALVRVKGFYGGIDEWDTDTEVYCDAGIATFSPAVRGSEGYGRAFYSLNDGDLGGNEVIDLFEGARWLAANGYRADRIGIFGRSHGGYEVMRALTFPPGTDGHAADAIFPFAFGIADAGFSDIASFYRTSNIPDWVLLEAGDPDKEPEKIRDRSPLYHVDLLNAPLMLVHGENDNRVPVAESRQMEAACKAAGKPCTYVEFPGEGHHVRSLADQVAMYQEKLQFLADQVL